MIGIGSPAARQTPRANAQNPRAMVASVFIRGCAIVITIVIGIGNWIPDHRPEYRSGKPGEPRGLVPRGIGLRTLRLWTAMKCHRFLLALVKRLTMEGVRANGNRRKKKSGDESPHSKSDGWHPDCLPTPKPGGA